MATISQISDNKFRAQIRIKGHPTEAKTWPTREEAVKWAEEREKDIKFGKTSKASGAVGVTLGQAIDKYIQKKEKKRPIHKSIHTALRAIKKSIGHVILSKLTDQHIVDYIEGRGCGKATGAFHFAALRSVLKMAEIGFNLYVPQVLDKARERLNFLELMAKSQERERRVKDEELEKLYSYEWKTKVPMPDIIAWALLTTMRVSEITRVEHTTFEEAANSSEMDTILITDRKHPKKKIGNHQRVPVLPEAAEIKDRQPKLDFDNRVFPFDHRNVSNLFTKACKALGLVDLHFHDLRHEGISRLFERGYQIQQVALFSGHEDWKMLERYTHLRAKDLENLDARKLKRDPTPVEELPSIGVSTKHVQPKSIFTAEELEEMRTQVREDLKREMMAKLLAA